MHNKRTNMVMKSTIATLALIWCSTFLAMASPPHQSPKSVDKWMQTLIHKHQKITKLHFYFHRLAGDAPSGVLIEQAANLTRAQATGFGLTVIRDDPLTLGPELSSTHVGYAQGLSATTSLEDVILTDYFVFYFTNRAHNGSTLAVLGSNAILHKYRELPIVGGTGVFRLARGVVTFQTVFYNATSGEAAVEADVVVFHYS